jgi:hypothetical protein
MRRKFSSEEVSYIKENFGIVGTPAMSIHLDRNPTCVNRKIRELGLIVEETQQSLKSKGLRKCCGCKKILKLEDFGKLYHDSRKQSKCSECSRKKAREYHYDKYSSLEKYSEKIIVILKKRKECDLTPEDILSQYEKQSGLCFYSKEKMKIEAMSPETISVDRIDSQKNYSKNNIVLCCHIVNIMKQSMTHDEFIGWCKKISVNN